jgi:small GTP-binding protein
VTLPHKVKGKRGSKGDMYLMYEILDTANNDQFTAMRELYIRNGKVFVVIYSVTSRISFENTTEIINQIKKVNEGIDGYLIILEGNKIDVPRDKREVTYLEGLTKAHEFDIPFIEVSAKLRNNTDQLFTMIGELFLCIKKEPKEQ